MKYLIFIQFLFLISCNKNIIDKNPPQKEPAIQPDLNFDVIKNDIKIGTVKISNKQTDSVIDLEVNFELENLSLHSKFIITNGIPQDFFSQTFENGKEIMLANGSLVGKKIIQNIKIEGEEFSENEEVPAGTLIIFDSLCAVIPVLMKNTNKIEPVSLIEAPDDIDNFIHIKEGYQLKTGEQTKEGKKTYILHKENTKICCDATGNTYLKPNPPEDDIYILFDEKGICQGITSKDFGYYPTKPLKR